MRAGNSKITREENYILKTLIVLKAIMSSIDHLRQEIKKSGYPFEIEISSLLDDKWDEVFNTASYFDDDEKKMRDIDVNASRSSEEAFPFLDLNLTIECKKDENFAWVFFTRPLKYSFEDIAGHYLDGLHILTKKFDKVDIREIVLGDSSMHYSRMRKVAVCYDEFYIKGKKTDYSKKRDIFEAVNQLRKFIVYSNEERMKSEFPYVISINFPCIIFDGDMYEAEVVAGEVNLKKAKHVLISTAHRSSHSTWDLRFLIDVVQKRHFKRFLKSIDKDTQSLKKVVKKNEKEISSMISALEGA